MHKTHRVSVLSCTHVLYCTTQSLSDHNFPRHFDCYGVSVCFQLKARCSRCRFGRSISNSRLRRIRLFWFHGFFNFHTNFLLISSSLRLRHSRSLFLFSFSSASRNSAISGKMLASIYPNKLVCSAEPSSISLRAVRKAVHLSGWNAILNEQTCLKLAWAKRVSGSRFWKSTQILYRVWSRFWKRDLFLLWNDLSKNPVFENQLKFCIGFGGGSGNGIFVSAINKLTQKSRFWKSAQIL